jgi:hypothetical protein
MSMFTGPRDDDQPQVRKALEHRRRKGRELRHYDFRVGDPANDLFGVALIFL